MGFKGPPLPATTSMGPSMPLIKSFIIENRSDSCCWTFEGNFC